MKRMLVAAFLVLLATGIGGSPVLLGQEENPEAPPVQAERYTFTMMRLHFPSVEVTDLWFPNAGIVFTISDWDQRTRAFYGKPRAFPKPPPGFKNTLQKEPPTREKIEVPRAIYDRIKKLADLSRQVDQISGQLGSEEAVKDLFVKDSGK